MQGRVLEALNSASDAVDELVGVVGRVRRHRQHRSVAGSRTTAEPAGARKCFLFAIVALAGDCQALDQRLLGHALDVEVERELTSWPGTGGRELSVRSTRPAESTSSSSIARLPRRSSS